MHFRVRKNVIQLIRTTYDAGKKRGTNTIVGTVRLAEPVLDVSTRALMQASEIEEFDKWLAQHRRVEELKEEVAAITLVESLALAQLWFERQQNSEIARNAATDIVTQWQSLRRIFVKNGLIG